MRRIILILLCTFAAGFASAQGLKDLRINEVLVNNVSSYENDYGYRSAWIELHNTGHTRLKLAGCYLVATLADGNEIEYKIPMDDPNAAVAPMGYVLFYCTGNPHHGTFYTNFTLDNVRAITLYNASRDPEPLTSIVIDPSQVVDDVTIGYLNTEDGECVFGPLPYNTPMATNDAPIIKPKYERFVELDPTGAVMTISAISVVFSVLVILFLLFKVMGAYMVWLAKRNDTASRKTVAESAADTNKPVPSFASPYTSEEIAAIALALKLYGEDLHDKESTILTINRVARAYSPWSSKIYGLRQIPRK